MLQTHAAISTSLTGNRSSYWNLKPTLQPPRVSPYSIAPVQKKWYSTGLCANRSSQPRAHEEEGSTVLLLSKRFSTSAAIRLLPRNIHAHSGEAEKIAESQRTRKWTANTNHPVFCGFLSVILPPTFDAIQERFWEHPVNHPQLFICLLFYMCFANRPLVLILKMLVLWIDGWAEQGWGNIQ